jgi:hypothetical protein
MSATLPKHDKPPPIAKVRVTAMDPDKVAKNDSKESHKNYKGFVAGVFSGVSKLTGSLIPSQNIFT